MPELQVTLPPEYDQALKHHLTSIIDEAIADARRQAAIDSPWLPSKVAIAKWLGIANNTLTVLINSGLPVHCMPNTDKMFGDKREITEWMLKQ